MGNKSRCDMILAEDIILVSQGHEKWSNAGIRIGWLQSYPIVVAASLNIKMAEIRMQMQ